MVRAAISLALLLISCARGQLVERTMASGHEPREKPADYPVHAAIGNAGIGAEYLVHSFSGDRQTFYTPDYLVVEVAVYPAREAVFEIGNGTFVLRINGRKQTLYPDAPGFVAASLKYPDWERRMNVETQASVGNADVIVGRSQTVERFPGDPRPGQNRLPRAPKAPEADPRSGAERQEPVNAADIIAATALPEGIAASPVSGYLYFRYRGKTKSIKSLELVYQNKDDSVSLALK